MTVVRFRTLLDILRQAGFGAITGVFLAVFFICSVIVWQGDSAANSLGDGMWFSFQAVSTIGFGDIVADGPVARIVTVVLSIVSIFYIAMVTGVAVSYCNARLKAKQNDTLTYFMGELERLDEMDSGELASLAQSIREYRKRS